MYINSWVAMQLLLQHHVHKTAGLPCSCYCSIMYIKQLGCHAAVTAVSCIQTAGLPCCYLPLPKVLRKRNNRVTLQLLLECHVYIHTYIYANTYIYYKTSGSPCSCYLILGMLLRVGKHGCGKSFFTCHSTRHFVGMPANNAHVLLRMRQFCIKCPPQAWLSNINFV